MKARIINNVEEKPNFITVDGIKLDIQVGMYSIIRIKEKFGGIEAALSNLDKANFLFDLISILVNEAIVVRNHRNDENNKLINGEYLAAISGPEELKAYSNAIRMAFGLSIGEPSEEDKEIADELDAALADEDIEETEKN